MPPRRRAAQAGSTPNRAVGYVRVSTEEQADEGVSLDAQEARLRAYCALRGLDLAAVYRDEGVSGGKVFAGRPAGGALLAALAAVTVRGIARELATAGHRTKRGGQWHASTVRAVWGRRAFYERVLQERVLGGGTAAPA